MSVEEKVREVFAASSMYDFEVDSLAVELIATSLGVVVSIDYCNIPMSDYDITDHIESEKMLDAAGSGDLPYTGFIVTLNPETGLIAGQFNVHPDYQGRGFGRELIEITEGVARAFGLDQIEIESPNENFFKALGYEIDSSGGEDLLAVKRL